MFTRHVIMRIKPDSAAALALIFENEVTPLLRGQKGMRHDDIFISPEISEAVMNSYWDTEGYADAYVRAGLPGGAQGSVGRVGGGAAGGDVRDLQLDVPQAHGTSPRGVSGYQIGEGRRSVRPPRALRQTKTEITRECDGQLYQRAPGRKRDRP